VSVNECAAHLTDTMGFVRVGLLDWGHGCHLMCFMCGTSPPSAQCSATAVQLHSGFGSCCIQNGTVMFLFYWDKTVGLRQEGGRIETYRNGL
jgi:hypothetical protein